MCTGTHPFIPAAGVIEARLQYATAGGVAENVLHYLCDATVTPDALAALGDLLKAWFSDVQAANMTANDLLERILLKDLTAEDSFELEYVTGMPIAGLNGTGSLPDNVTAATKFGSGLSGRSFRGRIFWVGLPADYRTGDILTETGQTNLNSSGTDLLGFSGGGFVFDLVIVSYCHDHAWRTTAVVTPVLTVSTDRNLDSMRRRLAGRGI